MYVILLLYVTDERNVDTIVQRFHDATFFYLLYIGTVYITVYDIFQQKDSSAL